MSASCSFKYCNKLCTTLKQKLKEIQFLVALILQEKNIKLFLWSLTKYRRKKINLWFADKNNFKQKFQIEMVYLVANWMATWLRFIQKV